MSNLLLNISHGMMDEEFVRLPDHNDISNNLSESSVIQESLFTWRRYYIFRGATINDQISYLIPLMMMMNDVLLSLVCTW